MDARRARILAGSVIVAGLLGASWVVPVAAAGCSVTAPATVNVGGQLTMNGTGFPAGASVVVKVSIEGGATDEFTLQANSSGGFQINQAPETADLGKTTVVATAGTACTAQVVYTVLGAGVTAPPTAAPSDPAAGSGSDPTAPRTDAIADPGAGTTDATGTWWLLAILAVVLGLVGLVATRTTRTR